MIKKTHISYGELLSRALDDEPLYNQSIEDLTDMYLCDQVHEGKMLHETVAKATLELVKKAS